MIAKSNNLILIGMVFGVFVICLFRGPSGQFVEGFPFRDGDDVLRMVQAIDLWEGQNWHDLTQKRLNPPVGVEMHWSRLPDIPLVAVLIFAEKFMTRDEAILFASNIVPPLLGILFFLSFLWAALPLVGRGQLPFAGLTAMAMLIPFSAFVHGRIDHHGWQLIFAMITAGGVARACLGNSFKTPLIIASISGALGLWVGAEGIVNIGVATIVLISVWALHGGQTADQIAFFGLVLTASSILLFPLALPIQSWSSPACDAFSVVTLGLTGAVAVFGSMIWLLEKWHGTGNIRRRILLGSLLGASVLWLLWRLFPVCFEGPYSGVSPEFDKLLSNIKEAKSLWSMIVQDPSIGATFLALPLVGFSLSTWQIVRSVGRRKTVWIMVAVLIGGGIAVTVWQIRGSLLANAYAGIALAWFVARVGVRAREKSKVALRILYKGGPALGIALLPFVPPMVFGGPSNGSLAAQQEEKCEWMRAVSDIQRNTVEGADPLLMAVPLGVAPIFLLFTEHGILGSLHHRNSDGVRDTLNILYKDKVTARRTAAHRRVNILVACNLDKSGRFFDPKDESNSFYYELAEGKVPEWLVTESGDSNVIIYRVVPKAGQQLEADFEASPSSAQRKKISAP